MANYNTGKKYNVSAKEALGFNYNSAIFTITFKIGEQIVLTDELKSLLADFVLNEVYKVSDSTVLNSFFEFNDNLIFNKETANQTALMQIMETLNANDSLINLIVSQLINDDISILEELNQFSLILANDEIETTETLDLKAIYNIADQLGLTEINNLVATILAYQELNIIDRDSKTSISDFYIKKSEDGSFDVLMPFGFKIDWGKTLMNFMPEASDSSIEIQGLDGELVQDTVYKARNFDIVAYSDAGITSQEREYLKTKIANTLELIKSKKKKLTIGNSGTSFDVKYSGVANIDDSRGNFIKLELPLKSPSPYGYNEFEGMMRGSGLLVNAGIISTGPIIEIEGPFTNANILIGARLVSWQGTILINEKLIIDCENGMCYKVDANNFKTNVATGFNGNYIRIEKGSVVVECNSNIESLTTIRWKEKFLWGSHNETF